MAKRKSKNRSGARSGNKKGPKAKDAQVPNGPAIRAFAAAVGAAPNLVASLAMVGADPIYDSGDLTAAPSVSDYPTLSKYDAKNRLLGVFIPLIGDAAEANARITISDEKYLACPIAFLRAMAVADPTLAPGAYKAEIFDCDDFVMHLKVRMSFYAVQRKLPLPAAVGFLLTDTHAFNFCFDPDGQLYILNTQSDSRSVCVDPDSFSSFLSLIDPQTGNPNGNKIASVYI